MAGVEKVPTLNDQVVCANLAQVTAHPAAWVFLQEPNFVGFGVVQKDKIAWPPGIAPDWSRVADLRLFGEKGEWHVWQLWDRTLYGRVLQVDSIEDPIEEFHYLWGTTLGNAENNWVCLTEDRGISISLPSSVKRSIQDEKKELPLRLKVVQVVGYEDESGLAGIVDAALVGLFSAVPERECLKPPADL